MSIRIRVRGTEDFEPEVPHISYFMPKTVMPLRAGWTRPLPVPTNMAEIERRVAEARELLSFMDGHIRFMNSEHAVAVASMRKPSRSRRAANLRSVR